MKFHASNNNIISIETGACFVFTLKDINSAALTELDKAGDNQLLAKIQEGQISADLGDVTPVFSPSGSKIKVLYIVGLGDSDSLNETNFSKVMSAVSGTIKKSGMSELHLVIDDIKIKNRTEHWISQKITEKLISGLYSYDATKSTKNPEPKLNSITLVSAKEGLQLAIENGRGIGHGINVTRELANLPGNICTPTYLAEQAHYLANAHDDITTEVLDEAELEEMGMGCFMSVSRGSDQPGKLIIIRYKGAGDDQKPHVLVGKGITFDTGGISLKPGAGMDEMKFDMGGAASVIGTMSAIAELKPALNVIGVIAAAENMPSGRATKPGDVVTSLSGKTVEILNTDAEGRLVLCDALTYVERFEPASVIDIATLTGAIVVGLGHHPTGVYANNEQLQQEILNAGLEIWDRGWAMPLWDDYREEIDTPYADLANIGTVKGAGGSITAAMFLAQFTEKYQWAHLDIAGTAWQNRKNGSTGRPVGMLTQYLLNKL